MLPHLRIQFSEIIRQLAQPSRSLGMQSTCDNVSRSLVNTINEIGRSLPVSRKMSDNPRLAYIEPNCKFKSNKIGDGVKI